MSQLASALHYIHDTKKLAHRDVKSENTLLTGPHGDAKLADFGLCKDAQRIAQEQVVDLFAGTPNYQPNSVHLVNICQWLTLGQLPYDFQQRLWFLATYIYLFVFFGSLTSAGFLVRHLATSEQTSLHWGASCGNAWSTHYASPTQLRGTVFRKPQTKSGPNFRVSRLGYCFLVLTDVDWCGTNWCLLLIILIELAI